MNKRLQQHENEAMHGSNNDTSHELYIGFKYGF